MFVWYVPDWPECRYARFGYVGPSTEACQRSNTVNSRASCDVNGMASAP